MHWWLLSARRFIVAHTLITPPPLTPHKGERLTLSHSTKTHHDGSHTQEDLTHSAHSRRLSLTNKILHTRHGVSGRDRKAQSLAQLTVRLEVGEVGGAESSCSRVGARTLLALFFLLVLRSCLSCSSCPSSCFSSFLVCCLGLAAGVGVDCKV